MTRSTRDELAARVAHWRSFALEFLDANSVNPRSATDEDLRDEFRLLLAPRDTNAQPHPPTSSEEGREDQLDRLVNEAAAVRAVLAEALGELTITGPLRTVAKRVVASLNKELHRLLLELGSTRAELAKALEVENLRGTLPVAAARVATLVRSLRQQQSPAGAQIPNTDRTVGVGETRK